MSERKAWVYRAYDKSGRLLYVGCSIHPRQRLEQHSYRSEWFKDAYDFTYIEYENKRIALSAEKLAIENENPAYNYVGNPNKKREGRYYVGSVKHGISKEAWDWINSNV